MAHRIDSLGLYGLKRTALAAAAGVALTATLPLTAAAASRTVDRRIVNGTALSLSGTDQISITSNGFVGINADATRDYALAVQSDAGIRLANAGTILAGSSSDNATKHLASAFAIQGSGDLSGQISNTGTIEAVARYDGTNTSQTAAATAITLDGALTGTLDNSDTIAARAATTAAGRAFAHGIDITGGITGLGELTNETDARISAAVTGTSQVTATALHLGGPIAAGDRLTNNGTLRATAAQATSAATGNSALAYALHEAGPLDGSLVNNGLIEATAHGTSQGTASANGVWLENDLTGSVFNSGTIRALASGAESATAFGLFLGDGSPGSAGIAAGADLTNSGRIAASVAAGGSAYAAGLFLDGNMAGTMHNTGTMTARASATADAKARALQIGTRGSGVGQLSGNLTNTGIIRAQASGTDVTAEAISVEAGVTGRLENAGSLSATAKLPGNSESLAYAAGIYDNGDLAGPVRNDADATIAAQMQASGPSGSGTADAVYVDGSITGRLENAGSLTASAQLPDSSNRHAYASGIYDSGNLAGSIRNDADATIAAKAHVQQAYATAQAIHIDSGITGTGRLENAGSLSATASEYGGSGDSAHATGIYIDSAIGAPSDTSARLDNTGTIAAEANVSQAAATLGTMGARFEANAAGIQAGYSTTESGSGGVYGSLVNTGHISADAQITAQFTGAPSTEYSGSGFLLSAPGPSARATGIALGGPLAGSLVNRGTITASARNQFGLSVSAPTTTSVTGAARATGRATGLHVGGDLTGSLANAGTIAATAANQATITSGSENTLGVAFVLAGAPAFFGATLSQAPTTEMSGCLGSTDCGIRGVNVTGSLAASGRLQNAGTIKAGAHNTVNMTSSGSATNGAALVGARVTGLHIGGDLAGQLVNQNSGTIAATAIDQWHLAGAGSAGGPLLGYDIVGVAGLNVDGDLTGSLQNNGAITATARLRIDAPARTADASTPLALLAVSQARGVDIAGNVTGTFRNNGAITASVRPASGGVYSLPSSYARATGLHIGGTLTTTLTNAGNIAATVSGNPGNAYSIYVGGSTTGASASILNETGAHLTGNLHLPGNISLTNRGTVTLPYASGSSGGDLTPQSITPSGGDPLIGGNFTQTQTGTLGVGVYDASQYTQLTVGGTADLAGRLRVHVTPGGSLSNETLTGIVDTSGGSSSGVTGTFADTAGKDDQGNALVFDNSLAYNFSPVYTADKVNLNVENTGMTTIRHTTQTENDPSAAGLGGLLDSVLTDGVDNPEIQQLLDRIAVSSHPDQVTHLLDQYVPLLSSENPLIESRLLGDVGNGVNQRLGSLAGASSGGRIFSHDGAWLKPFGSLIRQGHHNGVAGYKAGLGGLMLGADRQINEQTRLGVAFSYAYAHVESRSDVAPQRSHVNLLNLTGYGRTALTPKTTLTYQLDIGRDYTDGRRSIPSADARAHSSHASTTAHAGLGIHHAFQLGHATRLVPEASLDYTLIHDESYREHGAGSFDLRVGSHTYHRLDLGLGGKLIHRLDKRAYVTLSAGGRYDALNEHASVHASLAGLPGTTFVTRGMRPSHWTWHGGLGVTAQLTQRLSLTGGYDIQAQTDYTDQTLSAKLRWLF